MTGKPELDGAMEWKLMWKKTKVMRISRQPFPAKLMVHQKQLENVEHFKYLCSVLTNDGRCTVKLNPGLLWQNGLGIEEETSKILHLEYNFIWC
jgi:hypothetical protein